MTLPSEPYSQAMSTIPVSELRDAARNTSLFNQLLATLHPTVKAAVTGVRGEIVPDGILRVRIRRPNTLRDIGR